MNRKSHVFISPTHTTSHSKSHATKYQAFHQNDKTLSIQPHKPLPEEGVDLKWELQMDGIKKFQRMDELCFRHRQTVFIRRRGGQ